MLVGVTWVWDNLGCLWQITLEFRITRYRLLFSPWFFERLEYFSTSVDWHMKRQPRLAYALVSCFIQIATKYWIPNERLHCVLSSSICFEDDGPTLSSSSALSLFTLQLILQGLSTNPVLRVIEALFIGTKAEYGRTPRPTKNYLIDNHSTSVCFPWMTQGNSEEIRMLPTRSRTYDQLIITYNEHKGDEEFWPCKLKGRSLNRWRIGHTRKKKTNTSNRIGTFPREKISYSAQYLVRV